MKFSKYTLSRLLAAFKYAQTKARTAYHITLLPGTAKDFDGPDTLMTIDRTARGTDDRDHFLVRVNVKEVQARTSKQLRRDAGHEILHAILWDLDDNGTPTVEMIENVVYKLQRALYGEDNEA